MLLINETKNEKINRRIKILKSHLIKQENALQFMNTAEKDKRLIGFPKTIVESSLFSREEEKLYTEKEYVIPKTNLVEMPKGEPPKLEKLFQNGFKSGHICVGIIFK
jgi:hypothetical protein